MHGSHFCPDRPGYQPANLPFAMVFRLRRKDHFTVYAANDPHSSPHVACTSHACGFCTAGIKKTDGGFPSVKCQSIEFVREGAEQRPFIVWGTSGTKRGFDQVRAYQSFPHRTFRVSLLGTSFLLSSSYTQSRHHTLNMLDSFVRIFQGIETVSFFDCTI